MRPGMAVTPGMATSDPTRSALTALRLDRWGATSIEYALIATFISIMVVGWATFVGDSVSGFFMSVASGF